MSNDRSPDRPEWFERGAIVDVRMGDVMFSLFWRGEERRWETIVGSSQDDMNSAPAMLLSESSISILLSPLQSKENLYCS
jgi:hypothetical protein